jgi:hypothetical protein
VEAQKKWRTKKLKLIKCGQKCSYPRKKKKSNKRKFTVSGLETTIQKRPLEKPGIFLARYSGGVGEKRLFAESDLTPPPTASTQLVSMRIQQQ